MSEWQPIETAPKNGTFVLLWWPFWRKHPVVGQFLKGKWESDCNLYEGDQPTHWQPLPEPPKP